MQLIAKSGDLAVIRLNPLDNVLIARQALPQGMRLDAEAITVRQPIPSGHKLATERVEQGQPLRRYGQIIGFASQAIDAGEHVHVHNVQMGDFARDYAFGVDTRSQPGREAQFQGIVRTDGRVATRNYIGILTSVNCSATVARAVADQQAYLLEVRALTRAYLRGLGNPSDALAAEHQQAIAARIAAAFPTYQLPYMTSYSLYGLITAELAR